MNDRVFIININQKNSDHFYNSFIFGHMHQAETDVWIGARFDQDRKISWIDNTTSFSYAPWGSGEPNNAGNNEYCVDIMRGR